MYLSESFPARSQIRDMNDPDNLSVQDTNEEALAAKISAIRKGYFEDHYAQQFAQFRGKRDIIIHRGYWARVHIVRKLIESAIRSCDKVQIVALGCGLQTLWFNLMDQGFANKNFKFVQLDLQNVVKRKIRKIKHSKRITQLFEKLSLQPEVTEHQHQLTLGDKYVLSSCDLSEVSQFQKIMDEHKLDPTVPTFFYAECVLSYINSDKVDELIGFINKTFNLAFVFDYEMYNPNDRFGQMMVKNFDKRGCPLIGIYKYPQMQNQPQRYTKNGFKRTQVFTMKDVYYECIDKEARMKIEKLEMLDQLEEWNLIMAHYFGLLSVTYNEEGEKHPSFKQMIEQVKMK